MAADKIPAGKKGAGKKEAQRRTCRNLLMLFDEVEQTHQFILEEVLKALKIHNDEEAVRRILRAIKDKLI